MVIGALLAALGGLVALVGIENPRRKVPCVDCPGGALAGASRTSLWPTAPGSPSRRRRSPALSS